MNSVPLSVNSATLVATASSFFSFNCRPAFLPHFCRSLCPAPKPIRRRRSQTPRLLCSACSLQIVTHFRRHWNGFEVCTHNLQGSSQSKQRAVEFTVHRQVRTHGHNAQQTHELCQPAGSQNGECSLQTNPSGTTIIYPLMRHIKLPITLQLALI